MANNAQSHRGNIQEDSTRQWSFMGFEWAVRDVHRLRDVVEGVGAPDTENSDFDILKQSPMLGDNKFKLEIGASRSLRRSS
ncbi:hypothetical protein H0H87_001674 [Tephrocybe sp. NHM501043]|nr:hypothetical protein H0H87_001674 [Tephrocybe sp. NHM501043]